MMDVVEIQKILPHRYPLLLIDRVTDIVNNEKLLGFKNVSIGEQVFSHLRFGQEHRYSP